MVSRGTPCYRIFKDFVHNIREWHLPGWYTILQRSNTDFFAVAGRIFYPKWYHREKILQSIEVLAKSNYRCSLCFSNILNIRGRSENYKAGDLTLVSRERYVASDEFRPFQEKIFKLWIKGVIEAIEGWRALVSQKNDSPALTKHTACIAISASTAGRRWANRDLEFCFQLVIEFAAHFVHDGAKCHIRPFS